MASPDSGIGAFSQSTTLRVSRVLSAPQFLSTSYSMRNRWTAIFEEQMGMCGGLHHPNTRSFFGANVALSVEGKASDPLPKPGQHFRRLCGPFPLYVLYDKQSQSRILDRRCYNLTEFRCPKLTSERRHPFCTSRRHQRNSKELFSRG